MTKMMKQGYNRAAGVGNCRAFRYYGVIITCCCCWRDIYYLLLSVRVFILPVADGDERVQHWPLSLEYHTEVWRYSGDGRPWGDESTPRAGWRLHCQRHTPPCRRRRLPPETMDIIFIVVKLTYVKLWYSNNLYHNNTEKVCVMKKPFNTFKKILI